VTPINSHYNPHFVCGRHSSSIDVVRVPILSQHRPFFSDLRFPHSLLIMFLFSSFLLFILSTICIASQTVSKPGEWVKLPSIGRPDSWLSPAVRYMADGENPLAQNVPQQRNKHVERIPVLGRTTQTECDCPPSTCRPEFLTSEALTQCRAVHAANCHKYNAACPAP